MVLSVTTSTPVSPTALRPKSVASVNHILLTGFVPSPKKLMPDIGNVRKRLLDLDQYQYQ